MPLCETAHPAEASTKRGRGAGHEQRRTKRPRECEQIGCAAYWRNPDLILPHSCADANVASNWQRHPGRAHCNLREQPKNAAHPG